jgi:hypothetical protein
VRQVGSFFMINLCLVVIATQFSETKKREMERMLAERKRQRQLRSSSSTLASGSTDPGTCYDETLRCAAHLLRRTSRRLRRLYRTRFGSRRSRRRGSSQRRRGSRPSRRSVEDGDSQTWRLRCSRRADERIEDETAAATGNADVGELVQAVERRERRRRRRRGEERRIGRTIRMSEDSCMEDGCSTPLAAQGEPPLHQPLVRVRRFRNDSATRRRVEVNEDDDDMAQLDMPPVRRRSRSPRNWNVQATLTSHPIVQPTSDETDENAAGYRIRSRAQSSSCSSFAGQEQVGGECSDVVTQQTTTTTTGGLRSALKFSRSVSDSRQTPAAKSPTTARRPDHLPVVAGSGDSTDCPSVVSLLSWCSPPFSPPTTTAAGVVNLPTSARLLLPEDGPVSGMRYLAVPLEPLERSNSVGSCSNNVSGSNPHQSAANRRPTFVARSTSAENAPVVVFLEQPEAAATAKNAVTRMHSAGDCLHCHRQRRNSPSPSTLSDTQNEFFRQSAEEDARRCGAAAAAAAVESHETSKNIPSKSMMKSCSNDDLKRVPSQLASLSCRCDDGVGGSAKGKDCITCGRDDEVFQSPSANERRLVGSSEETVKHVSTPGTHTASATPRRLLLSPPLLSPKKTPVVRVSSLSNAAASSFCRTNLLDVPTDDERTVRPGASSSGRLSPSLVARAASFGGSDSATHGRRTSGGYRRLLLVPAEPGKTPQTLFRNTSTSASCGSSRFRRAASPVAPPPPPSSSIGNDASAFVVRQPVRRSQSTVCRAASFNARRTMTSDDFGVVESTPRQSANTTVARRAQRIGVQRSVSSAATSGGGRRASSLRESSSFRRRRLFRSESSASGPRHRHYSRQQSSSTARSGEVSAASGSGSSIPWMFRASGGLFDPDAWSQTQTPPSSTTDIFWRLQRHAQAMRAAERGMSCHDPWLVRIF